MVKEIWSGVPGDSQYEFDFGPVYNNPKYREANQAFKDPIVEKVLQRIKERSAAGMKTYGVPMTRPDTTTIEWLRHAQEEALDFAVYLERIIWDMEGQPR